MAFTEFYCQSGGDNLNAGSTTGNAAAQTYAGGTFVRATGVFTVASGDPTADGVAVGDFASIYTTAGATVATFVGRVTARTTTTITVSLTAISGATSTVSETAAATTCKVGGAWKGPNAAENFPFNFVAGTLTNSSGDRTRVNLKNSASYSITALILHTKAGPLTFQGYATTVGDLGRATIDGTGNNITCLQCQSASVSFVDLIVMNDGSRTTGYGIVLTGGSATNNIVQRCVMKGHKLNGIYVDSSPHVVTECECYSNGSYGMYFDANADVIRTISHDNGSYGLYHQGGTLHLSNCIFDTNTGDGVYSKGSIYVDECDFYANTSHGMELARAAAYYISNSNFIGNGGYGVSGDAGFLPKIGYMKNCGFGSGTAANTSGASAVLSAMEESGTVTYGTDLTPYTSPAGGDFRISLAAAKGAGRGTFTQTAASYSGTVGYPDIGAAQHAGGGGAGGPSRQVVGAGRRWSY